MIVPNHGRDISEIKKSIKNSSYKNIELVEVDEGKERSIQRNIGIDRAKGDAFLILDSDQSFSNMLIQECIMLTEHSYSCLYIPENIIAESFFGKVRTFERTFYTATAIDVPRFVLKKYCPKFNEDLIGPEDADWGRRIKGERATTKFQLFHHDDIGIGNYLKKKAYYTKSMNKYKELNPDDKCINIWYRCVTVFVENGKWKKLFMHPILSMCIFLLLIARGVVFYGTKKD